MRPAGLFLHGKILALFNIIHRKLENLQKARAFGISMRQMTLHPLYELHQLLICCKPNLEHLLKHDFYLRCRTIDSWVIFPFTAKGIFTQFRTTRALADGY
jgi:hypothetical protein